MKISFIGGGNMGEAMLSAVLAKGLSSQKEVTVSDLSQTRLEHLEREYGVTVTSDNRQAVGRGDIVVLAIKPQNLDEVAAEISGEFKSPQLVVSIIAGARIDTLCQKLGYRQVVRVMPNTPAQVGEGMSVWTATPEVTGEQRQWAGSILGAMGRDAEAGPMLTETLAVQERLLGEDHPDTLRSAGLLGTCLTRQGRLDEAEVLQLRCWTGRVRVLGEAHMNTLGSLGNLAILYQLQGRYAEAEELFEKLLELQTRSIGADHPSTMGTYVNLALLYNKLGRLEEAEELLLPVLESQRRVLGEEHRDTLGTLTNLGSLYNSMGRFEDAAGMFEVSLPAKRRVLGDAHPWTGYALEGLVQAYLNLGRTEDALPLQRQVLERTFAERAGDDPSAEALDEYARTLLTTDVEGLRDPVRALDLASRACERAETEQEAQLWQYLDTLALAQHTIGDNAAAVATQRRALALMPEGANPEMSERLAEYEAALEDDSEE